MKHNNSIGWFLPCGGVKLTVRVAHLSCPEGTVQCCCVSCNVCLVGSSFPDRIATLITVISTEEKKGRKEPTKHYLHNSADA